MNINFSSNDQSELQQLVAAGRFASVDEAIGEGVRLLLVSEKVQIAIDEADRGELVDHDAVFADLKAKAIAQQA